MMQSRGFTLLEMVVVLVIMGIITSLALPGLQKMYDAMRASLDRNELRAVLNHLALDVRNDGRPLTFFAYPADSSKLPTAFIKRIEPLDITLQFDQPLAITSSGFCPAAAKVKVTKGSQSYDLTVRSPDCRIINNE